MLSGELLMRIYTVQYPKKNNYKQQFDDNVSRIVLIFTYRRLDNEDDI